MSNLREATPTMNNQNKVRAFSSNRIGLMGVSKERLQWKATITVAGDRKYLGLYKTPEEAHEVFMTAKRELHALG